MVERLISFPSSSPLIRIVNLKKRYGNTVALAGVSISFFAGEIHSIIGENGAGKSTLVKILSGSVKPDAGEIYLEGKHFSPQHPLEAKQNGIILIYQELSLIGHLSVLDNIFLGQEIICCGFIKKREMEKQAELALSQLGHAEIPLHKKIKDLSPGEQQIVEISRALIGGCKVLILDEPTSSLSYSDTIKLFNVIKALKHSGISIIYISHFLEEILEIADKFTVLKDGTVVGTGKPVEVGISGMARMMTGLNIKEFYPRTKREISKEILIETESLEGIRLPKNVSFKLYRGEILGIAGTIGSGRTEMLRAIYGLAPVKSGNVKIGVYSGAASPYQRLKQKVGYLTEDRSGEGLARKLSIMDNIMLASLDKFSCLGIIDKLKAIKVINDVLKYFNLKNIDLSANISTLSGGNQQKIIILRLLLRDVDILLLDEPTRGIDVGSKVEIYRFIDSFVKGTEDRKRGVIFVSSYLPELLGMCDRIAVMFRGVLSEPKSVDKWDEHSLLLAVTGSGIEKG